MTDVYTLVADQLSASDAPCATSSFQAECVVLLHILREVRPDIPVLFLDTVHHFPETYAYRDRDRGAVGTQSRDAARGSASARTLAGETRGLLRPPQGRAALRGARALRRLVHGPSSRAIADARQPAEVEPFALASGKTLRKVSPLARWTTREVWDYATRHDIPLLPLYQLGYTSIGCAPCTTLPLDPSDARSGRWGGQKRECGIHIQPVDC